MSDKVLEELPHTAISTWSGFVYQGKIALYHCLKKMLDSYEEGRKLRLQLESNDDFAIFNSEKCLSIHQVKAYKDDNFSAYSNEMVKQQNNAKARNVDTAYFHVAKKIRNIPNSVDLEKDYIPVKLYCYRSEEGEEIEYCLLDKIDIYLEHILKELIKQNPTIEQWKANSTNIISLREILEACINDKVIAIHHRIHISQTESQKKIASTEFIYFTRLYEIIENNDLDILKNEEYFLSRLKIDIGEYYQEFCDEDITLSSEQLLRLDTYITDIVSLDKDGMLNFLFIVMPHKKGAFSMLSEFKNHSIDVDSMRYGLLKIFSSLILATPSECGNVLFTWKDSKGQLYYPTGIHTANESADIVCSDIIKHSLAMDVEFLFEGASLITLAIDRDSIGSIRRNDIKETIMSLDLNKKRKITNFQNLKMISLAKVPRELKE